MFAIRAIYDGGVFKPEEPVPVKEKYEVIITFTKPINTTQEEILREPLETLHKSEKTG